MPPFAKTLLLLPAIVSLMAAQQKPVEAIFTDLEGNLRLLCGVEGAWETPLLVPGGVLSSGYNGRSLWFKTRDHLHIRSTAGEWSVLDAPPGAAAARFASSGDPALFYFPGAAAWAQWSPETRTLQFLDSPPELDPAWPEIIGPDLVVHRRPGTIVAVRSSSATALLLPLAELPSFQLFFRDGTAEVAVGASFTMPPAAPGESSTARFRIRNPTNAPVLINRLSIDPGPFKTFDQFYPPRYLEAGGFLDFSVRFSPSGPGGYSRTLYINDLKVILNGAGTATSLVEIELPTGWQTLHSGDDVSLGSVERGTALTRRLRITPLLPAALSGQGFALLPGASSSESVISFLSDTPGSASGALIVDGRTFTLRVTVTDFPTPRPSLLLQSEPAAATQARFKVKLSEPARSDLTAVLSLAFIPAAGLPDDPAIVFLPQAIRNISLHIPTGAAESDEAVFQSGTTAGTITLRVTLGQNSDERTFRILPQPVTLSAARASAASANAEVTLTGFDTSRTTAKVAFTFYLKSGQPAAPGRIEADVTQQFAAYYQSVTGGSFTLRANFPVSGTYTELDSVEVEIVNSAGPAQTGRLRFE